MQAITYKLDGQNFIIPDEYRHLVTMKYRKDFYREFDIEPWTFRRRLKAAGEEIREKGQLSIESALKIYRVFGWPPKMIGTH